MRTIAVEVPEVGKDVQVYYKRSFINGIKTLIQGGVYLATGDWFDYDGNKIDNVIGWDEIPKPCRVKG